MSTTEKAELLELTADIVSAFVANNSVTLTDLSALISETYAALSRLGAPPEALPVEPLVPAVSIRKSVTPDAIICLEDGKAFKSLKRHIGTKYGLTPDQYRAKWKLPPDYPMVAPSYAEARSAMAKTMGLGRQMKRKLRSASVPVKSGPELPPAKRGRPKKAQ